MFLGLLTKLFEWLKMGHLVSYLRGILFIGRPARVFFPKELLEQGMSVVLTGLNNTLAVQSNTSWIWPYWIERQKDPYSPEFIPTGLNLLMTNLSHRNWTGLGIDGAKQEGMLDPVGMLTLKPHGFSIFPYLRIHGESHYPPKLHGKVFQKRLEGDLPAIMTAYEISPQLLWESESVAVRLQFEDFILQTHTVQNLSPEPLKVIFGIALRPYHPLGIGHIHHIRYKKKQWRVNGLPALLHFQKPHLLTASDRHIGDPLFSATTATAQKDLSSKSGIACGMAEYEWTLEPGESQQVQTLGYLKPRLIERRAKYKSFLREEAMPSRDKELNTWREHRKTGMWLEVPDEKIQKMFYVVKNHLHVFDDGAYFAPGSFLYHSHWFRDSCFISMAFDHLGLFEKVKPKLKLYPKKQLWNGFFRSHTGEWDSNGEAIYSLVSHARKANDKVFLAEVYPAIKKGVAWIEKKRHEEKSQGTSHEGLLPAGFSAEHFGPNDHYFWDNFWSLEGIRLAIFAAKTLGKKEDVSKFEKIFEAYQKDVERSMAEVTAKAADGVLPSSPYRRADTAAIGGLVALSPLRLYDEKASWAKATVDYLWEHNLHSGLFFQRIVHTGLNPYLTVQLAKALVVLEDERALSLLKRLTELASPTGCWPEAIHPHLVGGCMGDGDHGWAAAEYINLLREMLVRETETEVILAPGVFLEWLLSKKPIAIHQAPTDHGVLEYHLVLKGEQVDVTWKWAPYDNSDTIGLVLSLPSLTQGGKRIKIKLTENQGHLLIPTGKL